jgi:hypothetical protein
MLSNHIKKGFWSWATACVVLWVLSKHSHFQQAAFEMSRVAILGLGGGTALAAIALFVSSHLEQSRAAKRLTELYRRVQSAETIEVRGGSGLPRLIALMALAGILVVGLGRDRPDSNWVLQSYFGAAAAIFAFLELLTIIPLLRQPILRISRDALESPVFGKLSWSDIEKLDLREVGLSGFGFHNRLNLFMPRLPSLSSQLPPATRLKHRLVSIFRPSTRLGVRLLGPSELPKVILTLCKRIASDYAMESRREQTMAEMKASVEGSLESSVVILPQIPTEYEKKFRAQIDAVGFKEALRLQMEELRAKQDELWESNVRPPRELMLTHWTTWIAAAVCAVLMAGFIYLLYSNPL